MRVRSRSRDSSVEEQIVKAEIRAASLADRNMSDEAAEEYAVVADLAEQEGHPAARRLRKEMRRMRVVSYARRQYPNMVRSVTPLHGRRLDVETWSFVIRIYPPDRLYHGASTTEFVRVDKRGHVTTKAKDPRYEWGYGARGR